MSGMPGMESDEREQLLAFLDKQREFVRLSAHGLSDEQARATPSVSALSIGGIVKHLAATERSWLGVVRNEPRSDSAIDDYVEGFRMRPEQSLTELLDDYAAAAATTDVTIRGLPLDHPVPVPAGVPWFPQDLEAWDVRWVVLHLIEETARHAGHADIVRESIDGATWFSLMAATAK